MKILNERILGINLNKQFTPEKIKEYKDRLILYNCKCIDSTSNIYSGIICMTNDNRYKLNDVVYFKYNDDSFRVIEIKINDSDIISLYVAYNKLECRYDLFEIEYPDIYICKTYINIVTEFIKDFGLENMYYEFLYSKNNNKTNLEMYNKIISNVISIGPSTNTNKRIINIYKKYKLKKRVGIDGYGKHVKLLNLMIEQCSNKRGIYYKHMKYIENKLNSRGITMEYFTKLRSFYGALETPIKKKLQQKYAI